MKKTLLVSIVIFIQGLNVFSQSSTNIQCYPSNWWTGMKYNQIQLMVHIDSGMFFSKTAMVTCKYPGLKIQKVNRVENDRYLFIDVLIATSAKPGIASIIIQDNNQHKKYSFDFQLKASRKNRGKDFAQGVTSKDFIYLIMPDRFSNGDSTNDRIPGMRDQSLRRDTVFNRHGGDLKGIQNHLDYLQDLGVTTLWLNPVLENDMPNRTEHGYAFTNHYKIDARLGGAEAYKALIDATHQRGMKVIQDAVYNHVGSYHHTVLDPPMKDWLHQWDKYTNTSYKDQCLFDPYHSNSDAKIMSDGWFVPQMPDLNQNNPYCANFLIQHAIWCVEEFGIDGWRIDTYAYNDLKFMNRCNKALMDEYPSITLFGETWVHGVPNQSYFAENNIQPIAFKSNLQAVTDFQLLWGIKDALTQEFGWTEGVNSLYTKLSYDFLYKNPMRNVIFLDNHDINRFYSTLGEDVKKYKCALSWLMTCRGIPQFYYTSEFATPGFTSPSDGYVRLDFPGGWEGDAVNKFEASGRSVKDNEIFNHVKALANFRKTSSAITSGKLMQFVPQDGLYVYFRYDNQQTIMVVMNTSKTEKTISFDNYGERTKGFTKYFNVVDQSEKPIDNLTLGSYQSLVIELRK